MPFFGVFIFYPQNAKKNEIFVFFPKIKGINKNFIVGKKETTYLQHDAPIYNFIYIFIKEL